LAFNCNLFNLIIGIGQILYFLRHLFCIKEYIFSKRDGEGISGLNVSLVVVFCDHKLHLL